MGSVMGFVLLAGHSGVSSGSSNDHTRKGKSMKVMAINQRDDAGTNDRSITVAITQGVAVGCNQWHARGTKVKLK